MQSRDPDRAPARVAVASDETNQAARDRAARLADELALPLISVAPGSAHEFDLLLVVTDRRVELREPTSLRSRPLYVDFAAGSTAYRRISTRGGRELIARAIGVKPDSGHVVDATAGLAQDTFQLGSIGYGIVAIERSPVLGALVCDGLDRARRAGRPALTRIIERITLQIGDAREILPELAAHDPPPVVYLDPMYTPRARSALVKKEMRICRWLVGDDPDAGVLFQVAKSVASRRVVVKRHAHAPPLHEAPDVQFKGRSVRYDVYLTQHHAERVRRDASPRWLKPTARNGSIRLIREVDLECGRRVGDAEDAEGAVRA